MKTLRIVMNGADATQFQLEIGTLTLLRIDPQTAGQGQFTIRDLTSNGLTLSDAQSATFTLEITEVPINPSVQLRVVTGADATAQITLEGTNEIYVNPGTTQTLVYNTCP